MKLKPNLSEGAVHNQQRDLAIQRSDFDGKRYMANLLIVLDTYYATTKTGENLECHTSMPNENTTKFNDEKDGELA